MYFDYTIVGGGLVGLTAALTLGRMGFSIAVIESSLLPSGESSPSYHPLNTPTLALSYATYVFLEKSGIWPALCPHTHPILSIDVSVQDHWGRSVIQTPKHYPALGYVVNAAVLKSTLLDAIQSLKNVQYYDGTQVSKCALTYSEDQKSHWCCDLRHDQTFPHQLRTRILLVAEGLSGAISQQLQFTQSVKTYPQTAMLANVRLNASLKSQAIERFIHKPSKGVIALLPWQDNHATLIISVAEKINEQENEQENGQALIQHAQMALGDRYGVIEAMGKPYFTNLSTKLSCQHFYQQLVLMGNSVHSIHPIAAQGFNLSVRDINRLSQAVKQKENWGNDLRDINQYVIDCQRDQKSIITLTDQLAGTIDAVPQALKSMGVLGFDCLKPLKHSFTRFAMGLDK